MSEFLLEFVRQYPMLVLGILALLVSTLGVSTALIVRRVNADNRFYDKLEADSLSQINQNVKDIERILSAPFKLENGTDDLSLNDILDSRKLDYRDANVNSKLSMLSPYFAEYCANLDKYNSNIIPRKQVCMVYQEHGKRARRILELFERNQYGDISFEFAKLHLKQANISY